MRVVHVFGLLALSIFQYSAMASAVSITANFSQLSVGGYWNLADAPYTAAQYAAMGMIVNGQTITPSDPHQALANPSSVNANISGQSVTFGYGGALAHAMQNTITFTPAGPINVLGTTPGEVFLLGTLSYTNGAFLPLAFLDFTLSTQSSDAALNNQTLSGRLRLTSNIVATTGTNPASEADSIEVADATGNIDSRLGKINVYDYNVCPTGFAGAPNCNSGSVQVYGSLNSLSLSHFTSPTGGAFLTGGQVVHVPLSGVTALLLIGLTPLLIATHRRKHA